MSEMFSEAPASFNVKFVLNGYDAMLTLRDTSGLPLLRKAAALGKALNEMGATPTARGTRGNGAAPKVCPVHHVEMRRHERSGQVWYSHKAINPDTGVEYWCKGEKRG